MSAALGGMKMKKRILNKEWERLFETGGPKGEVVIGDIDGFMKLLGFKRDVKRGK